MITFKFHCARNPWSVLSSVPCFKNSLTCITYQTLFSSYLGFTACPVCVTKHNEASSNKTIKVWSYKPVNGKLFLWMIQRKWNIFCVVVCSVNIWLFLCLEWTGLFHNPFMCIMMTVCVSSLAHCMQIVWVLLIAFILDI